MSNGYPIHENSLSGEHPYTRLQKIKQYIEANVAADLSNQTLAQQFGLSKSGLQRIFQHGLAQTCQQYVEEIRLQHAMFLITREDKMIKEAMFASGYKKRDTFYKAFKKKFKHAPTHFKTG